MMNKDIVLYCDFEELKKLYITELSPICILAMNSRNTNEFARKLDLYLRENEDLDIEVKAQIIRLLDFEDKILHEFSSGENIHIQTIDLLYKFITNSILDETFSIDLYIDLFFLLKGLWNKTSDFNISKDDILKYMRRWNSGLDENIEKVRRENKNRIINLLIEKIDNRKTTTSKYLFENEMTYEEKFELVEKWWNNYNFHLSMAIKSPKELNKFLGNSLSDETMELLYKAKRKEMPFFYTPYYLSLLAIDGSYDDLSIRSYILYSEELVETYGSIKAWEKEDSVEVDKPNAAGWLLPNSHNVHRRYPEVAILIPDTRGRSCGGLCASCQRMYDFQSKRLNFDHDSLAPKESWSKKLNRLMKYFEEDTQIRDILLTGGDALMTKNKMLKNIFEAILLMTARKRRANLLRKDGEKYAEIQRIRIGSRLLAYLPMRIDDDLIEMLRDFRERGSRIGIKQFVIQTHFQTPLEITPIAADSIRKISSTGWIITNQLVYNVAVSRKGHNAKLRQSLNQLGIFPYYTFTVKGFKENYAVFTPIARSIQEQKEEKIFGKLSNNKSEDIINQINNGYNPIGTLNSFMDNENIPFISTDRSVLNLPAIGKSMTFSVVGITNEGKRILAFKHDNTRLHSPIVDHANDIYIVENKSIAEYLRQISSMKEDIENYNSIWYYTEGETEKCFELFQYPRFDFNITKEINHYSEI